MRKSVDNFRLILGIVFVASLSGCESGNASAPGGDNPLVGDAGISKTPDAAVSQIALVFSSLPATLYAGQSMPVTVTVTAPMTVTDLRCYVSGYSMSLSADEAATTCSNTIEANAPCVYAFTFKSWPNQMPDGATEMQVIDEIDCWSSLFDGPKAHFFYVTVKSTSLVPIDDAGASVCTSGTIDAGGGRIQITSVPPRGQTGYATGTVSVVDPFICHMVAVYIYVKGFWWIKPTYDQPLTTINPDGTWSTYITTGGYDVDATMVAAYLVPNGFAVSNGGASLPESLAGFPSAEAAR